VFTLRCTGRLLKRLNVEPVTAALACTTRLGDWYANLVHVGRRQLVLAISERTFLPVVILAAPNTTIVARMRAEIREMLSALGVPSAAIAEEDARMNDVRFAKTANRQVVGVLSEFGQSLAYYLDFDETLLEVQRRLAITPCSPLYATSTSPDRATAALFGVEPPRHQKWLIDLA